MQFPPAAKDKSEIDIENTCEGIEVFRTSSNPIVLLIDDNFMNNVSMQAALEELQVASDAAISGEDGIDLLVQRIKEHLDPHVLAPFFKLLIVDYSMPGMDGI